MLFNSRPALFAIAKNLAEPACRSAQTRGSASLPGFLRSRFTAKPGLLILALISVVACLRADEMPAGSTNLVIGLLVPPEEPEAASLRDGAILGVEQANQSPGPQARLIIRGRNGQWGADGVEAARMVTDDGALGLIAPPDGAASHLVLQVSGRTAVPVISLCADSSVTQTGVPWMVRIVPRTVDEANVLFAGIHASHWNAVIPDGRAGRETARDLGDAATNNACFIEKLVETNPSLTNTARFGKQILANHPDAVLLWVDPATAGKLAKTLRDAGFTGTLAGPGRLRSASFSAAAGNAEERLMVASPVLEPDAVTVNEHFIDSFRARFSHEPDATAAAAYDAARLLIQILRQTGDHPAHEAFPIDFSFTGATGVLVFDSRGNRKGQLHLLESQGGQFVPAEPARTNNQ